MGVHETGGRIVALGVIHDDGGPAQGLRQDPGPLFPFLWALWTVVGVEQECPAYRAASSLLKQQGRGDSAHQRVCPASPLRPVPMQGRVVRGRGACDHLVANDLRPSEPADVGAAVTVTEQPAVLLGRVERTEVPVDHPGRRLVLMGA